MSYDFKFGDLWLSEFRGVTTAKPTRDIALYDGELKDIAGKSGSEFIDNHRYKNVVFTREIAFNFDKGWRIENLSDRVIEWLAYAQGYQDFEDTLHEGMVTKAVLMNFSEVVSVLSDKLNTATLKFSRIPFWFRKDSLVLKQLDLTAESPSITLKNPYKLPSEPLIMIQFRDGDTSPASVQYSLTNGGVTQVFSYSGIPVNNSVRLFIDCEEQEVRSGTAASNNLKYLDLSLPAGFNTGETTFSMLGDLSRFGAVAVAPRWRCL